MWMVYDAVYTNLQHRNPLPPSLTPELLETLIYVADRLVFMEFGSEQVTPFLASNFFSEVHACISFLDYFRHCSFLPSLPLSLLS